jgi:cell division protein FtsB
MMATGRPRRAGDRSWRRWAVRIGSAVAAAALVGYLPYRLVGGASGAQLERMQGDLDRTRFAITQARASSAELRREIDALRSDPGAVEDIARRDLGMVRPGDLVLRIDPAGGAP